MALITDADNMSETPVETVSDAQKKERKSGRIQELTNLLQHVQADFENYKKRAERDAVQMRTFAAEQLIVRLLPVLDSFELALKQEAQTTSQFRQGMENIFAQLTGILVQEGMQRIHCVGKAFDPFTCEALLSVPAAVEAGTVLEELQAGYCLNGRVLRTAKVKIAATATLQAPAKCTDEEEKEEKKEVMTDAQV